MHAEYRISIAFLVSLSEGCTSESNQTCEEEAIVQLPIKKLPDSSATNGEFQPCVSHHAKLCEASEGCLVCLVCLKLAHPVCDSTRGIGRLPCDNGSPIRRPSSPLNSFFQPFPLFASTRLFCYFYCYTYCTNRSRADHNPEPIVHIVFVPLKHVEQFRTTRSINMSKLR